MTRRGLRLTVRAKMLALGLGVVAASVVLAGYGAVRVAWWVVLRGDMMAPKQFPTFQRETLLYLALVSVVTFGFAAVAAWILSGAQVRRLLDLRAATEAIAAGDYAVRIGARWEDELGDLAAAVDHLAASLGEVERLRRDLVANVAHELRTPLTTVQGLIEAMQAGVVPRDDHTLGALGDEIARLIRLVQALHELSVSDRAAGRGIAQAPLDVAGVVREVAAGMGPLFEQKRQVVEVDAGPAALPAMGDRDALVQILVNLLDNACKYSPEGERVTVRAERNGAGVNVLVSNAGVEIAPEDLSHVFERFYRGEKSRARDLGGFGIGLAIAKNLADASGATLTVSSDGGWTRFTLALPAV